MSTRAGRCFLLALVGQIVACGGDGTSCGEGTVEMDGECVPAEVLTCAPGTVQMGSECVPDGTMVCGDGTVFDSTSGACVLDPSACAEGTVLVGSECVPYDDAVLGADVAENTEPNGFPDDGAGVFTVPAIGDLVTIHGCINPYEDLDMSGNLDMDIDAYYFTVDAPSILLITVDGLNGLSGGSAVLPADTELGDAGWIRFGLSLVNDVSRRQVFLPKAGTYALGISDSRSYVLGEGFGGPESCYLATVEQVAVPAATPLSGNTATGNLGDPQFYSYDPDEGDILFNTLAVTSNAASAALVAMVNGAYRSSGADSVSFTYVPADASVAGLSGTDTVTLVADHVYTYSISPVEYTLEVQDPAAQPLPTAGGSVTISHDADLFDFLWFDVVNAGDLVRLQLTATVPIRVWVADSNFQVISQPCPGPGANCASLDRWVHFVAPGRYYLAIYNDNSVDPPPTYQVTSTITAVQPAPIPIGTPIAGASLSSHLANWYRLDVSSADWLVTSGDRGTFAGNLQLAFYDRSLSGIVDLNLLPRDTMTISAPTDQLGRIVRNQMPSDLLVRVTDSAGGTAGTTFDVSVANRSFTLLNVTASAPANVADATLAAGERRYYLVTVPAAGYRIDVTATPNATENLAVQLLSRTEAVVGSADVGAAGIAETLSYVVGSDRIIGLTVTDSGGGAGSFDLAITGTAP